MLTYFFNIVSCFNSFLGRTGSASDGATEGDNLKLQHSRRLVEDNMVDDDEGPPGSAPAIQTSAAGAPNITSSWTSASIDPAAEGQKNSPPCVNSDLGRTRELM